MFVEGELLLLGVFEGVSEVLHLRRWSVCALLGEVVVGVRQKPLRELGRESKCAESEVVEVILYVWS